MRKPSTGTTQTVRMLLVLVIGFCLGLLVANTRIDTEAAEVTHREQTWQQEHAIRTGEPVAWVLSHFPGSDVARKICQEPKQTTRAGKVLVYCKDPDGKRFSVEGYEADWSQWAVQIKAPSDERRGPTAEPITDPNDHGYLKYSLVKSGRK